VLPAGSPEGGIARQDRAKMAGPSVAVAQAGDSLKAAKLLVEGVYRLPPGGFDSLPEDWQMGLLDNARVSVAARSSSRHHMRHAEGFHPADARDAG
jgi:hypothetical protein